VSSYSLTHTGGVIVKNVVIVVSLLVLVFVAVTPAFAQCPNCGGHQGGFGQAAIRYGQRSAAGWSQAGRSVVAAGRWAGSHVRIGDQAFIGSAIQGAADKATGKH
jgi:hypothetical protein